MRWVDKMLSIILPPVYEGFKRFVEYAVIPIQWYYKEDIEKDMYLRTEHHLEQAGLSPEQIARLGLKGEEAQRIESKKTKENRAVRRSSRRRKGA